VERAARRAVEDRIATEQAERLRQEQLAIEQEELALAVAKAAEEEVIRETERIELARQLQREENDDEEIKIRTLAYSHTREWYQPHKKCFSHRGRQLYVRVPWAPLIVLKNIAAHRSHIAASAMCCLCCLYCRAL
jgi:hypothetical protein